MELREPKIIEGRAVAALRSDGVLEDIGGGGGVRGGRRRRRRRRRKRCLKVGGRRQEAA